MSMHIWDIEITAITGVSFSNATNAMPVIAVIGTPSCKDDHLMTQNPYYRCQYCARQLTSGPRIQNAKSLYRAG